MEFGHYASQSNISAYMRLILIRRSLRSQFPWRWRRRPFKGKRSLRLACVKQWGEVSVNRTSADTGVNAAGDAGDTSPPIFWLGGTSMGISPPIFLCTFGYSRPILVVLAQWQHLMVSFFIVLLKNPKFATESTQTPLRELTIKKSLKFSTSEFTKIRHF